MLRIESLQRHCRGCRVATRCRQRALMACYGIPLLDTQLADKTLSKPRMWLEIWAFRSS
jgi:hypothetical protein